MIGFQSTLLGRTEVAQGTMAFQFERPRGFQFRAGQYIDLHLSGPATWSQKGLTHTFSIVSSPFSAEITLATRMRDTAFEHALSILPIGTEVGIEGPTGSVTLHSNASKPAVFLVTPLPIRPCGERPYRQPFQAFDRDHNERSAELLVEAFSLDCSLCWFGEHGFRVGVR